MKLIRLLAPLAMIVAGLAAPTPAAATEPRLERPLSQATLTGACTMITGTYVGDRLASACEISDGAFVCAEHCEYQITAMGDRPPLQVSCELSHGTFREIPRAEWACDLTGGGAITVTCPLEIEPGARLTPWKQRQSLMVCAVRWIPSEQPMS